MACKVRKLWETITARKAVGPMRMRAARGREVELFFDNDATIRPTHCWPCSIATYSTWRRLRSGHGVSDGCGQHAAHSWRGVSRESSGCDTIVPLVLQRDGISAGHPTFAAIPAARPCTSTFRRVCCQDAAAELELSCDLFSRQLETAEHSMDCCSAAQREMQEERPQGRERPDHRLWWLWASAHSAACGAPGALPTACACAAVGLCWQLQDVACAG